MGLLFTAVGVKLSKGRFGVNQRKEKDEEEEEGGRESEVHLLTMTNTRSCSTSTIETSFDQQWEYSESVSHA